MRVGLICPSNKIYMPYLSLYKRILDSSDVKYDVIYWDRFGIEEHSEFVYRDSKVGHRRGFVDYFMYSRFVKGVLNENNYDKVIVFSIQLVFFLKRTLIKQFSNNFGIDIRDYNKIIKYFDFKNVVEHSLFVAISSPRYSEWLPKSDKYVISHNAVINDLDELREVSSLPSVTGKISVGCIGALRDLQINIDLIDSIKNDTSIHLNYHGEGDINSRLFSYLADNKIDNVSLTGRYAREDEERLYCNNDIINVLRYNDSINNGTALPNRLYNALIHGKPLMAFEGTYLAELVREYELGIVLDSFESTAIKIQQFFEHFDSREFDKNRVMFLKTVIESNEEFRKTVISALV